MYTTVQNYIPLLKWLGFSFFFLFNIYSYLIQKMINQKFAY